MKICSECGATWKDSQETCEKCGTKLSAQSVAAPSSFSKVKGRLTTYVVVFLSLCIIAGAILWLFVEARDRNAVIYTENGTYFYVNQYDEPLALFKTEKGELIDPRVCADGDYLFYLMGEEQERSLYRVKLKGSNQIPTAVAADVRDYCVSDNGKTVLVKDFDNTLYTVYREEKEETAKNVSDFILAADGKSLVYNTEDGSLCRKSIQGNPDILAQDVDSLCLASDDLTTLIGEEDNKLFCLAGWNDMVYLTDGVKTSPVIAYDDGTCYFINQKNVLFFERGTEVDSKSKDSCKYQTLTKEKYQMLWVSTGEPIMILKTDNGNYLVKDDELKKITAPAEKGVSYFCEKLWNLSEGTLSLYGTEKTDEVLTFGNVAEAVAVGKKLFFTDVDGVCFRMGKNGKAEALNKGGAAFYHGLQSGTARYSQSAKNNGGR